MTLFELIKYVLTSWQVIAVTIAIVLYFSIVSYAARKYHRPKSSKKSAKKKKAKPAPEPTPSSSESNSGDEIIVEEE